MPEPSKPGQLLSGRWLNELVSALRAAKIVPGRNIRVERNPAGQTLSVKLPQEADWRITGGSNPYGGVEQRPVAGGDWTDLSGGRTVTTTVDPLYERNNNASVPVGTVVHARRDPTSGAWIFDRSSCSASLPPSNPIPGPTPQPPPPSPNPPAPPAPTPPEPPPPGPPPPSEPIPPPEPPPYLNPPHQPSGSPPPPGSPPIWPTPPPGGYPDPSPWNPTPGGNFQPEMLPGGFGPRELVPMPPLHDLPLGGTGDELSTEEPPP